jgi:hypothetical protein
MPEMKRLGRFTISRPLIDKCPEFLAAMMAELLFLPLRTEALLESNVIEYFGISPEFEEIGYGTIVPEYRIIINDSYDEDSDEHTYTWELERTE